MSEGSAQKQVLHDTHQIRKCFSEYSRKYMETILLN